MESLFEKLEELIKDDNKIVTVISLSQTAKISLQESQELINKYVELHKESGEIFASYILNGISKDTGELLIVQAKDENLEEVKQLYETEPTVIIFSLQRAKSIDYNVISLVQALPWSGQIIGKNCTRRVLTKKVLPTLPAPTVKGKSTVFTKQNGVKSEEKVKVEDKNNDTKTTAKGTMMNMFKGAQNKKSEAKPTEQKPKQNGGLSNFLTKQPGKDKIVKETKKEVEEIKPEPEKIKDEIKDSKSLPNKSSADLFDSDTDEEILKDLEMQEEKPKIKPKEKKQAAKKATPKNKRKKPEGSSSEKSVKKRKRIIVEESDSDGEKSDTEEPELMEIEEPEPVKQAPDVPIPKNKRRKAVKKIYEDDEGFIVTETEYVYETASEDENVPEVKAKPLLEKKSNSEPEISPNKASKSKKGAKKALAINQPTLMNFFKKK